MACTNQGRHALVGTAGSTIDEQLSAPGCAVGRMRCKWPHPSRISVFTEGAHTCSIQTHPTAAALRHSCIPATGCSHHLTRKGAESDEHSQQPDPPRSARRSLRDGHMRRDRRPDQAQAAPRALQPRQSNLLSREFAIVGFSRLPQTSEAFRAQLGEDMKTFVTGGALDPEIWEWLARRIYYVSGDFNDPATYQRLRDTLTQVDTRSRHARQLFLLPGHRARVFRRDRAPARRSRADREDERTLAARDHREAVRPRSRVGAGAQRGHQRSV